MEPASVASAARLAAVRRPLGFWTLPLGSGLTLPADVVGYLSAGDRPVLIVLDDLRRPDATPWPERLPRAFGRSTNEVYWWPDGRVWRVVRSRIVCMWSIGPTCRP